MRNREEQLSDAWVRREAEIRKEVEESLKLVDERIQWVMNRENELAAEANRLSELREELEEKMRKIDEGTMKCSSCSVFEIIPSSLTPIQSEKIRIL